MLVRRRKVRIEIEQQTLRVEMSSISAPLEASQSSPLVPAPEQAADISPMPEFSAGQPLSAAGQSSISSKSFEDQKENF